MPKYRLNITGMQKKLLTVLAVIIVVSICAYFIYPISQAREKDILIPVVPQNIPEGLTLTPPYMKPIEIRIRGPKPVVNRLKKQEIAYLLDLPDAGVGVISAPVNHRLLPFPKDIKVLKVTPSFVTVRIDREIKKTLPVDITFSGKPAKGYDIEKTELKPSFVMIKGPEAVLENITTIPTKPIDLGGASESFKKEVTLDLKEGITLTSSSKIILAAITIIEKTGRKSLSNIPVKGKGTTLTYEIQPSCVNIDISGPLPKLKTIDQAISAYVDLKGLTPGTYDRQAVISLPVDFTIIGISPERFKVTIKRK